MQRSIEGPDKDFLTLREVTDYLRVNKRTLQRLIASGEFPRPIRTSPRTPVWAADDLIYYRLRVSLAARLRRKRGAEPPADPPKAKKP